MATPEELTAETLIAPHARALDACNTLINDPARFQAWYTSRRAAKTSTVARVHLLQAVRNPGWNGIYTALTRGQAREVVWRTIWLPMLEKYEIEHKPNLTHQQSIFPNGSSVLFGGLDDEKHILTNLGSRLDLFTPDECQAAPSSLLKRLIEVIIAPAVSDTASGKICMTGTIPEVQGGFFYDAITNGRWLTKNWSRWDNPFLKDNEKALADHLRLTGLSVDDPIIQRDWFGKLVFDPRATAFRYKADRNSWKHDAHPILRWKDGPGTLLAATPPYGCDLFALGVDPGTRDRWAIVLWAWNSRGGPIWQVAEWVTPRNAGAEWSDCKAVIEYFDRRYKTIIAAFYDAGGSMATLDIFGKHTGFPVLKAAAKADLKGQVDRLADLFGQQQAWVMFGSELENDLKLARWDDKAREEAQYKWSSQGIHPDVADAGRYGVQKYFDYAVPTETKLTAAEQEEERIRAHWVSPTGRSLEAHAQPDIPESDTPYGGPLD